ncbi:MAG: leucine-rich repeat protein, partial [Kiritimatiellae bacterium]|nr:leucine-rich repeat protein [Kiritimatiellia bacterium]
MEKFKKLGVFVATAAALAAAQGLAAMDGAWTYEVGEGGTATLTAYAGDASSVTIPASVGDGVTVAALGDGLFANHAELESVRLEAALESVGTGVFEGCANLASATVAGSVATVGVPLFQNVASLTSVTLEEGVGSIANSVFSGTGIANLVLPDSLRLIGSSAFANCPSLTNITWGSGIEEITIMAFQGCTGLTDLEIPDSVTNLYGAVFSGCVGLTNVVIGEGVPDLNTSPFSGCTNIERVVVGGGVKTLSNGAFGGMAKLKDVELHEGIEVINNSAFGGTAIERLVLPDSVRYIGESAFSGCSDLTDIVWGSGIEEIKNSAFSGCTSLGSLEIPDSVTNLSGSAFSGCAGLTNVVIGEGVPDLNTSPFSGCTNIERVVVGGGVKTLSNGAFSGMSKLKDVELHEGIEVINNSVFQGTAIERLVLPDSVRYIGENGFAYCSNLTEIVWGEGLNDLRNGAFGNCSALTVLEIPNGVTNLSGSAFGGCTAVERVEFPDSLKVIDGAFGGCTNLSEVVWGESVEVIKNSAFGGCVGLTELVLPDSVTYIGEGAFSGCSGLAEITWGAGIENIQNGAFSGCTGLTSVTIPGSVTNFSGSVFSGCTNVTQVVLEDGVTGIGSGAFYGMPGLQEVAGIPEVEVLANMFQGSGIESVTIPDSVRVITTNAFRDCTNLTTIVWGTGVEEIRQYAFAGCTALTELVLPDSVRIVAENAFDGCTGLTNIVWGAGIEEIKSSAFGNCTALGSVEIPDGVTNLNGGVFQGCTGLTNAVVGGGVAEFGADVFENCPNLARIEVGSALQSAIWAVPEGGTVAVRAGIYGPISSSNKAIRIESMEGPETTMIDGGGISRCANLAMGAADPATRVLRVTNSATVLSGFTLCNGVAEEEVTSNGSHDYDGGGVHGGTLENCILRDNYARTMGGGAINSFLKNCHIYGNDGGVSGGGAYNCYLLNCHVENNTCRSYGGGLADCGATNCLIEGNTTRQCGGGCYRGVNVDCVIRGNHISDPLYPTEGGAGGGIYQGLAIRCAISNNWVKGPKAYGGAAYGARLLSCQMVSNYSSYVCGATYHCKVTNSVIAFNRADGACGAFYTYGSDDEIKSSFIWHNWAPYGDYSQVAARDSNNVKWENWGASGPAYANPASDPVYANPWEGDFRLLIGSPCINAGDAYYVRESEDMLGNPRKVGRIDLGPVEAPDGVGLDMRRIHVEYEGIGHVTPRACLVEPGGTASFCVKEDNVHPFLGWSIGGEIVSINPTYIWENVRAHGVLTACFGPTTLWVDAEAGDDVNPGTEEAPKASIQAAIDAAGSNDVIRVRPGTYGPIATYNQTLTIESTDGADVTVIDANWQDRCALLGWPGRVGAANHETRLVGFTLLHGTATNVPQTQALSTDGAAVFGGVLVRCIVQECGASNGKDGSIFFRTTAESCQVISNKASYLLSDSGGDATLSNCLITGNEVSNYIAYYGHLINCTIVGNRSSRSLFASSVLSNCIVWQNEAQSSSSSGIKLRHCCWEGELGQMDVQASITNNPCFLNSQLGDWRIQPSSPCLNRGANSFVSGEEDLARQPRVQNLVVDIGCYEAVADGCVLTSMVDGPGGVEREIVILEEGASATLTALSDGVHPFVRWEMDGAMIGTNMTLVLESISADHLLYACFTNTTLWVDANAFVDGVGTKASPGRNLQAVLDMTVDGDTIFVKEGVYDAFSLTGRSVRIVGVDGAEKCIIDGKGSKTCANVDGRTTLAELTLRNGSNYTAGAVSGGTLYHCIIQGNQAYYGAGASYCAGLYGCHLVDNHAEYDGGGAYYCGHIEDCVFVGNTASNYGGGVYFSASSSDDKSQTPLVHCTFVRNSAGSQGGGAYLYTSSYVYPNGVARNCLFWNNETSVEELADLSLQHWGDVPYPLLINCRYTGEYYEVETNTLTEPPEFVLIGSGVRDNYRLRAGSPLVDAGQWNFRDWAQDAAGADRLQGDAPDIGAYEGGYEGVHVSFVVNGEHTWPGGWTNDLEQNVKVGLDAMEPAVQVYQGWALSWDGDWHHVAEDCTITAHFEAVPTDWPVVVHRGNLTDDEIWANNVVHVVVGTIELEDHHLSIVDGAIVKFAPGASLIAREEHSFQATGVVFTHLFDDLHGGDTLQDGSTTPPRWDDYVVQGVEGEGNSFFYGMPNIVSTYADIRPGQVNVIQGTMVVPKGKTLVLSPGTILKFMSQASLEVKGRLQATGTVGNPVVFTSHKDDEYGGDTNGDGEDSVPDGGDWHHIFIDVDGVAELDHCVIRYNSDQANHGGLHVEGQLMMKNCIYEHTQYDCVNGRGRCDINNTLFQDTSLVFGYYSKGTIRNCVMAYSQTAVRQANKTFVNCVFFQCQKFTDQLGEQSVFSHCLFFNEQGYGDQKSEIVGRLGNEWGNPIFVNPAQGDFHLQEGSPAIDMGDGAGAPQRDFWGQPRVTIPSADGSGTAGANGGIPDAGIYEYPARYGDAGNVDLVAESILLEPEEGALGDEVTVVVRLGNQGSEDWKGRWMDRLELTDAFGLRSYSLTEKVSSSRIGAGQTKIMVYTGVIPAMPEGDWRLKVSLNVDRGVFEGASVSNNVTTFTNTLRVKVPAVAADGGTFV